MKCPEMYKSIQHNIRKVMLDEDRTFRGEYHLLIETQEFCECYKDDCVAWDKEKQKCRKVEQ